MLWQIKHSLTHPILFSCLNETLPTLESVSHTLSLSANALSDNYTYCFSAFPLYFWHHLFQMKQQPNICITSELWGCFQTANHLTLWQIENWSNDKSRHAKGCVALPCIYFYTNIPVPSTTAETRILLSLDHRAILCYKSMQKLSQVSLLLHSIC